MAKYQLTYERVVDLSTKVNIMFQKGLTEYVPMYSKIAPTFDSNGRANTYPLGRLPAVKEWLDDTEREIMKLEEAHYTLVNRKFEATLTIDREDIEDDQTSFYESQSEFLGKEAAQHPDHLCSELIINGFTENGKCYDGMPFFSNAHKWGNSDKTLSNFQDGTSEPWILVDSSKSVPAFFRQNRLDYIMEKPADLSEYTFMKDKYVVTKSYKGQLDLKYKDYADTYNNATLLLTEASKNFAAILGNNILPKITSFKNKLADIIFAFNDFIQKHKWAADAVVKLSEVLTLLLAGLAVYRVVAFASSILGLATAFEFVRTAIIATSIAVRFLTGAMITNPIIAVITALATGAYLIIKNWETLKSWFVSFFKWFENTAVFKFFKNGIEKVKDLFGKGSDIVVDNTTIQKAKENGKPSGNQKIVHNRQSYSVVVNSNTGNPKDIGEEVVHKLATGMVG